jgi:hypothetical protein
MSIKWTRLVSVTGTVGHHGGVYFELVIVKDDVSPTT